MKMPCPCGKLGHEPEKLERTQTGSLRHSRLGGLRYEEPRRLLTRIRTMNFRAAFSCLFVAIFSQVPLRTLRPLREALFLFRSTARGIAVRELRK
jgi:hypothetical protein